MSGAKAQRHPPAGGSAAGRSEGSKIARRAGTVAFFTFLSRILGLVRDMVVAFSFGAAAPADAFFVAFRIPNMLRRLVAEGALTASFLPVYTDYLENRTPEEAARVVNIVFTLLCMALACITLGGIFLSPWIISVFAPGFRSAPETFGLAVSLNRILFPYIFFVSLVALCMGVLNARGHFAAPAASPILLNVFMISGALLFSRWFDPPVFGLAVGVLIGGLFQLLLQVPALRARGVRIRPCLRARDPAVHRIARLFLPAAFGAAIYQLNVFVSNVLASFLPEGSISYLWYAGRLLEFPLGVFAIALATAAFPRLSQQSSRNDTERFHETLEHTLRLVTFITLPAMVGLILLRLPVVEVLFQRGAFDAVVSRSTADAVLYYALGMWAIAVSRILVSAFHSLQDTTTPVKISIAAFVANVAFSLALMGPMLHAGLALANSLSVVLNTVLLFVSFRRRLGRWGLGWVRRTGWRMAGATAFMAASLAGAMAGLGWNEGSALAEKGLRVAVWLVVGVGSYAVGCVLFGVRELGTILESLRPSRRADEATPPP